MDNQNLGMGTAQGVFGANNPNFGAVGAEGLQNPNIVVQDPKIFENDRSGISGGNISGNMENGNSMQIEKVVTTGNVLSGAERGIETQTGPATGGGQDRQVDAGLENAVGIVTVGASGVMPEEPQVAGMTSVELPNTAEEAKMERVPEEAKDGEKMEKAWMKRAQEVVAETRKDPNKRLVQVALLREEYMRKRFNRILGEHN